MDNSWHSTLQTSTPPMASSTSQEPRNQIEMNSSHYYPRVAQDLRSTVHERIQDPMFPNILNLSSYRSGHTELGSSFLSLLSGPPSLLQCDFQELSNPKLFGSSNKLPVDSSVTVSAIGSGVPLTSGRLLSENLSSRNMQSGANFCPVVSSGVVVSSNCSSSSVLHDGIQAANLSLRSSDLAKAFIHHIVPGNEKVRVSSLKGEWRSTSSANGGKLHSTNIRTPQQMPQEASSSVFNQSSTFTSGCPRVFCLGTSGHLLLSNTGLLGIVCSCHCYHMSVSKFCEHSGFCDVNPGDAVRMDGGETIAQWRRLYFQKFGIRVPEDQSGWDWSEGFSATAGLVKSNVTMPNISTNSDLANLVVSSGDLIRSGQPLDNIVFPKNPHTDQNLVIDALHNKQQRNGQDSDNFHLKGLFGTSQSNLGGVANSQVMESPISRFSTVSKFAGRGPDNGCHSTPAYIDSFVKTGNSSVSHPTLQNLRTFSKNSDVSRIKNVKDGVISDRDAGSSNIELRLGQPYQQGRSSGNSVLSAIGPKLFDALVHPPKSVFLEQMIHNAANYGEKDESRQYFHTSCPSHSTMRREQSQLNLGTCAFGIANAMDAAKLEKLKGEGSAHSKATNNMVNSSEHIKPKTLPHESHAAKCDAVNVPWNGGYGLEKQLNVSELSLLRLMDRGKGVECVADGSYIATDSAFKIHKQMEIRSSRTGVVGGSTDPSFSTLDDKSHYLRQLSSMPPDSFDTISRFNHPDKVPCLESGGHIDHGIFRSTSSPMGSGQILQSQGVSMGFPFATPMSTPGLVPAVSKPEDTGVIPYMLDENMRMLALRQILELSKQQHAIASFGMNQEQGRFGSPSNHKVHHSLVDSLTAGEQRHGPDFTSRQDVSEISMKSLPSSATIRASGDSENFSLVTGLNNLGNFPMLTQGISLRYREIDEGCQLSYDPLPNEQPALRLGRNENNITHSSEHTKCCPRVPCTYFQGSCGCTHTKCLGGNCESRVGCSPNTFKEQMVGVSSEASILVGSEFVKDDIVSNEKPVSLDQSGKLKGQLTKRLVCHASQWRDVPSKLKGACDVACMGQSADVLNGRGNDEGQVGDMAAKCSNKSLQIADSLKEQEVSNISSGCSAPAVTHASFEVNNMDSSTVDGGDTGCVNDIIVDEGSGIDKCWSSDDALESDRSAEFRGSTCMANLRKEGSSKVINIQSSRSLLDELKLIDSLTWKKGRNQIHTGVTGHGKTNHSKKIERGLKSGKRKREMKLQMLDAAFSTADPSVVHYEYPKGSGTSEWPSCSSKDVQMLLPSGQEAHTSGACSIQHRSKCGRSVLSSAKALSRKRDLQRIYNDRDEEDDYQMESYGNANFCKILEVSGGKKFRRASTSDAFRQFQMQEPDHEGAEKSAKHNSLGCIKASSNWQVNVCHRKARPIVCGEYGEISSGKLGEDVLKPIKIVSLSRILKTARRCTLPKKPKLTSLRELKKRNFSGSDLCFNGLSGRQKETENGSHHVSVCEEMNFDTSMEGSQKACTSGDGQFADGFSLLEKDRDDKSKKDGSIPHSNAHTQLKQKCKEIRKRSLYELSVKGKNSSKSLSRMKIPKCTPKVKLGKFLKNAEDIKCHVRQSWKGTAEKSVQEHQCASLMDSDAFCCVCGSSNKDEINCLLECSQCLIRVHQACYGISKVPKGHWYCRPCRTSSKDIVCVLCGYGGGAMTRALRSRAIVKSLLKAWNIETECRPKPTICSGETMPDDLSMLHSSGSVLEDDSFPVLRPANIEPSTAAMWKIDMQNHLDIILNSPRCVSNLKVHNSITAGVLDSTVKQWVHMVCGLWTPATRCPNVDTMSAFDVSGASRPRANLVCSMCNRPGGSCIQCRVAKCSVQFHPWCAHQKGLLQSEVEGVDNENVGFYGRCMLHATHPTCDSGIDILNTDTVSPEDKELTSARTEGYKGRKRDGFWHNHYGQSKGKGGCFVPQEQLNAWIHINGQNSCTQGLSKLLPVSDIEYDCRREYTRYKQAKGWKHLVVYKSGIHALGLYTSRFISRGEMVVEYVGEIVGQRVADKRENEYQSGRKLQYKSACYFFRIDKEHIIDATCKGGIARFVNHSCLPNCVAKVISVRNEKKVVFFAERDIYPGEEITYDYHFNHEDEGKKIPCFCNSRNCRRYLN